MQGLIAEIEHAIKTILLRHRLAQTVESRVCVEPLQGHACGVAITANYAALPIATDREAPFEPLQVSPEVPRHLLRRMSGHAC
jgi:hypothetical protein